MPQTGTKNALNMTKGGNYKMFNRACTFFLVKASVARQSERCFIRTGTLMRAVFLDCEL